MNKGVWDIIRANFVTSAVKAEQYPTPPLIEAAFIGRSNVGKSSLINSLCRRNGLARVSATPGKTQTINYYLLDGNRPVLPCRFARLRLCQNRQKQQGFMVRLYQQIPVRFG